MATPILALPPDHSHSDPLRPLPDLPQELLLTLLSTKQERDQLDHFVLSGAGDGPGGLQVEDILNELLPDGPSPLLLSPDLISHPN